MPMLKQALKDVLSESELSLLSSSFDVIGSIAVLKVPIGLVSKERLIGEEILSHVKNVRSVFSQASDVGGEFRIRDLKLIAGEENYETIYKESGCVFKVNVRDVYFSPRLSTERERIAKLAKDGERIFNMFAGVGTFSIVIAKTKSCPIDSVDKNPKAIELAKESLLMNKKLAGKVYPILADAKEYADTHESSFNRVLMPLPERADEFLPFAVKSCKEGGTIHYYVHVPEHEFRRKDWIETHLQELDLGSKLEVTNWRTVREVGPHYIQAVADLLVCRKT
jgi:tRNA (guanine37-N1)-methyltransferase